MLEDFYAPISSLAGWQILTEHSTVTGPLGEHYLSLEGALDTPHEISALGWSIEGKREEKWFTWEERHPTIDVKHNYHWAGMRPFVSLGV